MWEKICLFLLTIDTIKYRSTSMPFQCANRVSRCPLGKSAWTQKNNLLKCAANYGYVCLRDYNGYLFESCMANFTIHANEGNCPILYACVNNEPYLGTENTYYDCPKEEPGCPPKDHAEYSIHQLYKYPKCVESNSFYVTRGTFGIISFTNSPRTHSIIFMTTTSSDQVSMQENKHYVIIIVIFAILLITAAGCIIGYVLYSRKKRHQYAEVTYVENRKESEDGCPFFTEDKGRIKIQQKACMGNTNGCPEGIKDLTFLSSEGYLFLNCHSIPVKTTEKKDLSTKVSTMNEFVEVNGSRGTQADHFDSVITSGRTATMEEFLSNNPLFLLGAGLFVVICILIGSIEFNLFKRIVELRKRMKTENCMSLYPYRSSMTQPHQVSENEAVYDYVDDEFE